MLTEAVDGDRSLSVVLNDLVISGLGTSALDHGVTVTLKGKSVLADVDPPDVLFVVVRIKTLAMGGG